MRRTCKRHEAVLKRILRRGVVESLMRTQGAVFLDILTDHPAQLPERTELVDVDQLGFQAAEPALDHDVVYPSGLAVHALQNVQRLEKGFVLGTSELTALIGIEDSRGPKAFRGTPDGLRDRRSLQSVGELPVHDLPAVAVDDGRQIHVVAYHFDVSYIDGSDLT